VPCCCQYSIVCFKKVPVFYLISLLKNPNAHFIDIDKAEMGR
jgi:hypothetical protein